MAFNGYLLRISGTPFPMKYIKAEGYIITPNQRMESEAKRAVTGLLHRTTVEHTASKIEFTTPNLTNVDIDAMMTIFRNAWSSQAERKLTLEYYDVETNGYKTGEFYMPDIKWEIKRVDPERNRIVYNEARVAFIEY